MAEDSSGTSIHRGSSLSSISSRTPSQRYISLIDRTVTPDEDQSGQSTPVEAAAPGPSRRITSRTRTRSESLLDPKTRWKYGRYTEERALGKQRTSQQSPAEQPQGSGDDPSANSNWGQSTLKRGREHLNAKIRGKKQKRKKKDTDYEIDVLYENQRGAFIFGIPKFSSKALTQLEAAPWVDQHFNKSRVNITDAQLPDPSWEWVWRTWYVDMSRDVDEEGWEYSFYFRGFSWHGTHPWFTSFVRRRRWIRKRVRKQRFLPDKELAGAHMMNTDYFTIHSGKLRSLPSGMGSSISEQHTAGPPKSWRTDEPSAWEAKEVPDIGTLSSGLKVSPVDSERISLIRRFLDQGGDDLFYLADEMPTIMSYFFYEHSCRRLLAILTDKVHKAEAHRDEHKRRGEAEDANEERYIEYLLKAADAVDKECKKLEFWSDVRELTRNGETISATDHGTGWGHEWAGLDQSGPENLDAPPRTVDKEEGEEEAEAESESESEHDDDPEQTLQDLRDSVSRGMGESYEAEQSTESLERSSSSNNEEKLNESKGAAEESAKPPAKITEVESEEIRHLKRQATTPSRWVDGAQFTEPPTTKPDARSTGAKSAASQNEGDELTEQLPEPIDDGPAEDEGNFVSKRKKLHH